MRESPGNKSSNRHVDPPPADFVPEAGVLIDAFLPPWRLMALLLYGVGLRLMECLRSDIRSVQELLGHQDVSTTMIYTHVLNRPGMSIRSPADTS